ncbi:MAG TPA: NADH-quinone oxidoreductase subunit J, partial [Opitutaceae bacterium]|nr:NADH-quinone oxidoreductase subunit J [Opitutaceae bacterium]
MNALVLAPIFAFTLACAAAAFALRPLIRSVLLLVGAWAGIAVFFLAAGAEFVAFAQFLIYVGAVSMVALFAVLLTRGGRAGEPEGVAAAAPAPAGRIGGAAAGLGVFAVLAAAIRA